MSLTSQDRLNLKKLIKDSDCDDNTESIRNLKHSGLIRADVSKLENLKRTQSVLKTADFVSFQEMARVECAFLYNNYMDIFNKVLKDEIDLKILTRLLIVLKLIEENKVDQHEGSAMVGKILKELYIDSAIKCSDNLDKENESKIVEKKTGSAISWKEYKNMYLQPI